MDRKAKRTGRPSMCVRYTLRKRRLGDVAESLDAEFAAEDEALYKPRYNVAPADVAWVLLLGADRRVLRPARWKYLIGAKRLLMNIRSESVGFGRFRDAFSSGRCAVVTDGFYEWPGNEGEPVWFHARDDGLVLLGGLLQLAKVPGAHPRFSVLTTGPNGLVAKTHDRMPVIVGPKQLDEWLTGDAAAALNLLSPAPAGVLVATDVSNYVNSVKHDDPGCVASRAEGGQSDPLF
jgi:putative SOS response-associated peptidase YedK